LTLFRSRRNVRHLTPCTCVFCRKSSIALTGCSGTSAPSAVTVVLGLAYYSRSLSTPFHISHAKKTYSVVTVYNLHEFYISALVFCVSPLNYFLGVRFAPRGKSWRLHCPLASRTTSVEPSSLLVAVVVVPVFCSVAPTCRPVSGYRLVHSDTHSTICIATALSSAPNRSFLLLVDDDCVFFN